MAQVDAQYAFKAVELHKEYELLYCMQTRNSDLI